MDRYVVYIHKQICCFQRDSSTKDGNGHELDKLEVFFFFSVDDAWNDFVFFTKQIIEEKVNAVLLFLFPASVRILELEASLLESISCFVYKEYFECGSSLFLSGFFN